MHKLFNAFIVENSNDFKAEIKRIGLNELPYGDVVVKVSYSSVNYKE